MNFINCTPHDIDLYYNDIGAHISIPRSGRVARVATIDTRIDGINDMHATSTQTLGDVSGLPPEQEGMILLVSQMTRVALPHRTDLASPAKLVRDEKGAPIGWRGLIVNKPTTGRSLVGFCGQCFAEHPAGSIGGHCYDCGAGNAIVGVPRWVGESVRTAHANRLTVLDELRAELVMHRSARAAPAEVIAEREQGLWLVSFGPDCNGTFLLDKTLTEEEARREGARRLAWPVPATES